MSRIGGDILVKIPIPEHLLAIENDEVRRQSLKNWWHGYALRYPDYLVLRRDGNYVYMARKE
ncbi:hypothetical protein G3578_07545 [Brevibacillus sp. SYP-B805]|uniref:hypothetical protein n=1 Tax=Brevibacillus sp. SYP-B805 TaxID=1578199 RepID=UPI0013EA2E1A|nr:hypothetical protein [Brevibacillus sp. SYP-B805]NGQ95038.1 hypothetical protein [Brevibacillus sp. SYP-B805]